MRSLGIHGIKVYCIVNDRARIALYSKYCSGYLIAPQVEKDLDVLRDTLARYETQLPDTAVIFPGSDQAVLNLAAIRHEFDRFVGAMSPLSCVQTLVPKKAFYD